MGRQKLLLCLLLAETFFVSKSLLAVQFEPGVGLGLEFTDNARMTETNEVDDLITSTYVGASVVENDGLLQYDVNARYNKHNYTKDRFTDQRYFNLEASADWAMIKDRFNWILRDYFSQRPIITTNTNTPNNLQDTNAFTFGANINLPVTSRQRFGITPMFSQYYYETQLTDNRQFSLATNWNYQMFRLTNVGLNLSVRNIDYFEKTIDDTKFTNVGIIVSGQRQYSVFTINLGSTNVKRGEGDGSTGFSGFMNWLADLSSRSKFKIDISTELTDTSSVSATATEPGNGNDIQVTSDVIRNSVASIAYIREDASLNSQIWMKYNKVTYSDNPLDRIVRAFGLKVNRPINGRLSSGLYANYNQTEQLSSGRIDKRYTLGVNLKYNFSRKLHSLFDMKYRQKDSTAPLQNFNDFSVFATLVYGFGEVSRPTRTGGF